MLRPWLIACLLLFGVVGQVYPQTGDPPTVGFVTDNRLRTSSLADVGPDGLSALGQVFFNLGANVVPIGLDEPIPPEVNVVVLVRPQRRLSRVEMAHLTAHISAGGHLLAAVDPGYSLVEGERPRDSLTPILAQEFGLVLREGLLIEPWFSVETLGIEDLAVAQLAFTPQADASHPIIDVVARYDLPVVGWAARPLYAEPFGPGTTGGALFYAERPYAETAGNLFDPETPDPLEYNIEADPAGRLLIGGYGVNEATGARLVLLGDGEIVQNDFGLGRFGLSNRPLFFGNTLLAERAAAWLLGIPAEDLPPLPDGYTWLSIDGDGEDWREGAYDLRPAEPNTQPIYDVVQVGALFNDFYTYILVEAAAPLDPTPVVEVEFTVASQVMTLTLANGGVTMTNQDGEQQIVPDAAYAIADAIEMRLPLRVTGQTPDLTRICLIGEGAAVDASRECVETPPTVLIVEELDPVPMRNYSGPSGSVRTVADINLRSGPDLAFSPLGQLSNNTPLAVLGIDPSGAWVKVQNARYEGWLATFLIQTNTDLAELPVLSE